MELDFLLFVVHNKTATHEKEILESFGGTVVHTPNGWMAS